MATNSPIYVEDEAVLQQGLNDTYLLLGIRVEDASIFVGLETGIVFLSIICNIFIVLQMFIAQLIFKKSFSFYFLLHSYSFSLFALFKFASWPERAHIARLYIFEYV